MTTNMTASDSMGKSKQSDQQILSAKEIGAGISRQHIQSAIDRIAGETGIKVTEWSVYADDSVSPGRLTLFIETDPQISHGQTRIMCEMLEERLSESDPRYSESVRDGRLHSMKLNVLQPQTHQLYREVLAYQAPEAYQPEDDHVIDNPIKEKFFFGLIENGKQNRISDSARNYKQSEIGKMFRLASNISDVVNLCNGEPDCETPIHIIDAAYNALMGGRNKYSPDPGIPSFREAVAKKYSDQFKIPYESDDCLATLGGSEAMWLAMAALLNPGDEVIIPDPSYPNYVQQAASLQAVPVRVPLREENAFHLDAEDLEKAITMKTRAIVLNYPSNPTGTVLGQEEAKKLAEIILKYDLFVITDEVYEILTFDGRPYFSMAQVPGMEDHVIIANSLSKTYAMTGWRIGYAVCKERDIIQSMAMIQQTVASVPPTFIMHAGAAALNGSPDHIEKMRLEYEKKRDIIYEGLCDIPGIKPIKPEGSLCIFINIKGITERYKISSADFCLRLLKEGKVMSIPGTAFGPMGEGYLRLCFANSEDNIREGIRRLKAFTIKEYPSE